MTRGFVSLAGSERAILVRSLNANAWFVRSAVVDARFVRLPSGWTIGGEGRKITGPQPVGEISSVMLR